MAPRGSAASRAMAAARAAAQVLPVAHVEAPPKVSAGPHPVDAQAEAAALRDERLKKILPRATVARYDRKLRMIVVTFANGAVFSFPPALLRGFSTASPEQLANIKILRNGAQLRWEDLDTEIAMAGLLNQIFSTRKVLARIAGQAKSAAKTAAVRANGAKGGRPAKGARAKA
jgi:hypothetical protein